MILVVERESDHGPFESASGSQECAHHLPGLHEADMASEIGKVAC
jgi:hypothetical protein